MVSLSQQRASYALAVTVNHHARQPTPRPQPGAGETLDDGERSWYTTNRITDPAKAGVGGVTSEGESRSWGHIRSTFGLDLADSERPPTGSMPRVGVLRSDIAQVWIDCELGRVAICRHELSELRLWAYAHKFANGEGRILKSELSTWCGKLGIVTSRSTFAGIIARGNRLYWRERSGYLYLTSWKKLSAKLTKWEAKYNPDHVTTNRPGQRRVQLDLTGSLKLAHALIYNGWIAVKSEKLGYLEIARSTLSALWGRSKRQLLTWEKLVGIRAELRYAEHHDILNPLVPNYAYLCLDTDGKEFASWRLPNRFTPAPATISPHNGQRRKVRSTCNEIVKVTTPVVSRADGQRRVLRTGKTTFTDRQGKNGTIPAFKQLDKHLRKHHDILDRRHYAYIATRFGKHIFEMSDGVQRRNGAGRDWVAEKSPAFRQRRAAYRFWWLDRGIAL